MGLECHRSMVPRGRKHPATLPAGMERSFPGDVNAGNLHVVANSCTLMHRRLVISDYNKVIVETFQYTSLCGPLVETRRPLSAVPYRQYQRAPTIS